MIKDMPTPKPPSSSLETYLANRRRRSSPDQIAHEIVNQLTVLSLVGCRILARFPAGSDAKLRRDAEVFERSISEATVLVQRLANELQSRKECGAKETLSEPPVPGQVIRFLRGGSGQKR